MLSPPWLPTMVEPHCVAVVEVPDQADSLVTRLLLSMFMIVPPTDSTYADDAGQLGSPKPQSPTLAMNVTPVATSAAKLLSYAVCPLNSSPPYENDMTWGCGPPLLLSSTLMRLLLD